MRCLLISTLLLAGCGQQGYETKKDPRSISGVDPVFAPYVAQYVAYKGKALSTDIPIQFTDLPGYTVGLCTRWSTGERQIQVDKDYWDHDLTEGERYEVIAHELGHCDLNRDHVADLRGGKPVSVMYPYVFELLPSTIVGYMSELFNSSAPTTLTSLADEMDCVHDIEVK